MVSRRIDGRLLVIDLLGEADIEAEEVCQLSSSIDLSLPCIFALTKHGSRHLPETNSAARRKMAARSVKGMSCQADLALSADSIAAETSLSVASAYCAKMLPYSDGIDMETSCALACGFEMASPPLAGT